MPVKAIIRGNIENAITVWFPKGDPTQQALTHLRVSGVSGRQVVTVLGGGPPDTFVPGLHDLADVPSAALDPDDGGLLHNYAGTTRHPELWEGTPAERQALLQEQGVWDVWLRARGYAHLNGDDTDRQPFCAILASAALVDLLGPAVVWRDDQSTWADAPAKFKLPDGSPRRDLSEAIPWTSVGKYVGD